MATLMIKLPEDLRLPPHLDRRGDGLIAVTYVHCDAAVLLMAILEAAEELGFAEVHAVSCDEAG